MTLETSTIELGAVVTLGLALGLFAFQGVTHPGAIGRAALERYRSRLARELAFIRAPVRASAILAAQGIAALACAATSVAWDWSIALLAPLIVVGPRLVVAQRVSARVVRLDAQVEPWLNAIASALKASPSLGDALGTTPLLVGAPMNEEVDVMLKEYELGTPLDRALENLAARGRGPTLASAVLALSIARQSGGNLGEALETAAASLRELSRLEGVVRTKTAEGRAQTFVIAAMPVPMVVGIHCADPAYFAPLQATFTGHVVLSGAGVLWALAIASARKILSVDV